MTKLFIPETKNRPAKVKDAGLVNLVVSGSGVYNAKSGEVIFLPKGLLAAENIIAAVKTALFENLSAQPVGCDGSEEAVYSLAERFVREYGDDALSWMWLDGRRLLFSGWAKSREDAEAKAAAAVSALRAEIGKYLPDFAFIPEVKAGRTTAAAGVCETAGGALGSFEGLKCSSCGRLYLPNSAHLHREPPVNADSPEEPVADVHTPGAHTIPLLCEQLGLDIKNTLKAMLYTVEKPDGKTELLFAMIRGDKNVSIPKLSAYVEGVFPGASFRRAEAAEILSAFGEVAGFCGPVGVPDNVLMVADISIKGGRNFVVGGNRPDYHRTGACWGRDFEPPAADLLLYEKTLPCPECGGALDEAVLRNICSVESYEAKNAGETTLACRDRDGAHEWPYRWRGSVSIEPLLLAVNEKGETQSD